MKYKVILLQVPDEHDSGEFMDAMDKHFLHYSIMRYGDLTGHMVADLIRLMRENEKGTEGGDGDG